ncbi:ankyrin-1 [Biomphalaria glabrata]|uniref:Ankyrin homolog n=1 Tax=Biomphalaria glabrata TaxID=6526 RepID=A0A9W2YD13_BIOGL|nr:ankyrin homolog [Biomphalaria glabrata]KAI8743834.1 ankyrin-1-like [Biomphalaria glabrata]
MEHKDSEESFDPTHLPISYDEPYVTIPKNEDTIFKAVRFNDTNTILKRLREAFDINDRHKEIQGDEVYTIQQNTRMVRSLRLKEYTALHMAVIHGTLEIIEMLLSNGADINAMDANKFTPLLTAVAVQRPNVVQLLIQKGANVNNASASGRTPLLVGIENTNFVIVQALITAGADPNLSDAQGTTPLFMCFKSKQNVNLEIIDALIQGGAHVNHTNKLGATPLMMAAQLGEIRAAELLLIAGADINKMDVLGKNALHLTSGVKMALFLVNNGATSDYPDKHGFRPIDSAVKVGHYARIRLFLGSDCQRKSDILDNPKLFEARKNFPPFDQWLHEEILEPRNLKRLCRGVIRHCLSPFNTTKISNLPLPGLLKDYLLVKHIDLTYENLIQDKRVLI